MENMSNLQEREKNPSPATSPKTTSTTTKNGGGAHIPPPYPLTPKPTTPRSDPNPYPTTFVQADTTNFKHVVQMLTGSTEAFKQTPSRQSQIPPKKQGFKLYERRNSLKNSLVINPLVPNFSGSAVFSPRNKPEILSPSLLDFPSLTLLSPVTPLGNNSSSSSSSEEEERAIAEKGFYLHPKSPMSTPSDAEPPRLLPLFPVTSPRVSSDQSSVSMN